VIHEGRKSGAFRLQTDLRVCHCMDLTLSLSPLGYERCTSCKYTLAVCMTAPLIPASIPRRILALIHSWPRT
jgi:hypothetical protein